MSSSRFTLSSSCFASCSRFAGAAVLVLLVASGCGRTTLRISQDGAVPELDARPPDAGPDGGRCTSSAECDDRLVCNGVETCAAGDCIAGPAPSCEDFIDCTVDRCSDAIGGCVSTPDSSRCGPGAICDPDRGGCVVVRCDSDFECDDGLVCNGQEVCVGGTCSVTMPPFCDDANECTDDSCEDRAGGCVFAPRDRDGDGFVDGACGGDDCDDSTPFVSPSSPESCSNVLDDDCDGLVDCADEPCSGLPSCRCAPIESCGSGADTDCDGLVDCADPDCTATPACAMPCAPRELGSMFGAAVATGSTVGQPNRVTPACSSSNAPDVTYLWTAPTSGAWTIDTEGSGYDTMLVVQSTCTGPALACNDDSPGLGQRSRVVLMLTAGQPILIVVDGWGMGAGSYVLNIRPGAVGPEVCGNGIDDDGDGLLDCADSDCAVSPACCMPVPESCTNGVDDDCDRRTDCADFECRASPACCVPRVEICTDRVDQDCDGRIDCADPDCSSNAACCRPSPESCTGSRDEDCDGRIDCTDSDCTGSPSCCVPAPEVCGNGIDDDCDGAADCADPVCASAPACCMPSPEICTGGRDEDCDRLLDCADPDCAVACCVPAPEVCGNGIDDDCDRLVDCADPVCGTAPACCVASAEICDNGRDDDCDARSDCSDTDCAMIPPCVPACPDRDLGTRTGARVTSGTTVGAPNRFTPSCRATSTAGERAFTWTAPAAGEYLFSTAGSTFDTVMTLRTSCTGPELACDDDSAGAQDSLIRRTMTAGQSVLIVVDGFGTSTGAFVLDIIQVFPSEVGRCANGLDDDADRAIDCGDPDCFMDAVCAG